MLFSAQYFYVSATKHSNISCSMPSKNKPQTSDNIEQYDVQTGFLFLIFCLSFVRILDWLKPSGY